MLATGPPVAAPGAVSQVTLDSLQLELSAPRKTPPMLELSLVVLPMVSRSLAEAIVGQLVPGPVPLTTNRTRKSLTGLVSTVRRLDVPSAVVGFDASIVASSVA